MNSKSVMKDKAFSIQAEKITKRFNRHIVFKDIGFSLETGRSLAITGPNGSGKSTLLEIIAGIRTPTGGDVKYYLNNEQIDDKSIMNYIGYQSPRINPYNELSGIENIQFVADSRTDRTYYEGLLKEFGLFDHMNKWVKFYSSGMKQRLRFLLAILHDSPILLLDEPGTNLDESGKDTVIAYLKSAMKTKIILIATNDESEAKMCNMRVRLG